MLYSCDQIVGRGSPCPEQAAYRFLWPGYVEQKICESHALKARAIAQAVHIELLEDEPQNLGRLYIPGSVAYLIKLDTPTDEVRHLRTMEQIFRKVAAGKA